MLLPGSLLLMVGLVILVQGRGPHHPRGEAVSRRHHVHYKPNPDEREKLTQDSALLHDKQHIEEHLEDMVEPPDLSKMSDEELEFYYFKIHDTDKNNMLDGLEILQAISHISDETDVSGNINNDSNFEYYIISDREFFRFCGTFEKYYITPGVHYCISRYDCIIHKCDERSCEKHPKKKMAGDFCIHTVDLIDQVLTEDDIDNDGFLDYPEYVRSRQRSSKSIEIRKEEPPLVEMIP